MPENIEHFGAVRDDRSDSALVANVTAIHEASTAADDNAAYLPEGNWFIGSPDIWNGNPLMPGSNTRDRGVAGLSLVGAGPEKTFLNLGLQKDDKAHSILYHDDSTHPDTVWKNLTWDGRLDDFTFDASSGTVHWGVRLKGDGEYTFENVRFRNWAGNAVWNKSNSNLTFDRCTWENIGIKNLNDHDGTSVGHGIGVNIYGGQSVTVTNSEFHLVSGKAMDFNGNGTARVSNCWASGLGSGMFKVNNWDTVDISNVYAEADTSEYKSALESSAYDNSPDATFLHRLDGAESVTPTVRVDNIECQTFNAAMFSANRGYDLRIAGGEQGPLAAYDVGLGDILESVFRAENGSAVLLDIGKMSAHGVGGDVFNASDSSGTVGTLNWDNADSLGDNGSITISTNDRGGDPFSPTTPSQSDVGINSDQTTSDGSDPSVSWVSPIADDKISSEIRLQIDAGDAEDNVGAMAIDYRIDGGDWLGATYNTTSGFYEETIDASALTTGTHQLTARATDSDQNTTSATIDVTVSSGIFEEWTPEWDSAYENWGLVSGVDFDGEYALTFNGSRSGRYAISWDVVGEPADVEVLDKFRAVDTGLLGRVHLRSSTTDGAENGYWLELESREGGFRVGKYTNGGVTTLKRFGTAQQDTFFYRRFRAEGNQLKAKVWPASESEPESWDVQLTDDDHSAGWVGLGTFSPVVAETDVFSVAKGGATAPFLGQDGSPSVSWEAPIDTDTVAGTVPVQIAGSDAEDGEESLTVEYRVDDGPWVTAVYNTASGYFEDEWDSTGVGEGEHTFEARATDTTGNTSSAAVAVTVDNASAPTVDSLGITEVETDDPDAAFDVSWQVSDSDADLSVVDVLLTDDTDGSTVDSSSLSVSGTTDRGTTRLVAGGGDGTGKRYTASLTVTDANGTTDTDTESVTETSSSGPSIDRFSVSESGRPDSDAEMTILWDVSATDSELASVAIELSGSDGSSEGVTWTLGGSKASDIDTFGIRDGDGQRFDVTLRVTDTSGQTSSMTDSITA